ncbi:MAG: glycosyltransferase [Rhodothermales bacterium]|nr:glycosyltransferase [Rhodothermales bacterium]
MCDQNRLSLCVVSPCYNEQEVIRVFYHELKNTLAGLANLDHTIVLVDDGSSDGTLEALDELAAEDPFGFHTPHRSEPPASPSTTGVGCAPSPSTRFSRFRPRR